MITTVAGILPATAISIKMQEFNIEPGKCYCLTSNGVTKCFRVRGWTGADYDIETMNGQQTSLAEIVKGGLSPDYTLQEIQCP